LVLSNATAVESDPHRREALANRIGGLLEHHDTPGIAFMQAVALSNATAGEPDAQRLKALADRIRDL
jgi:hypothetical protein